MNIFCISMENVRSKIKKSFYFLNVKDGLREEKIWARKPGKKAGARGNYMFMHTYTHRPASATRARTKKSEKYIYFVTMRLGYI